MGAAVQTNPRIVWAPQNGPQHAFVNCPAFDVLYGGARGGGKSDACLGDFALHALQYGAGARGLFMRRELPQLEEAIRRSKEIYFPMGAQWGEQAKRWVFPNGATLLFRMLEREDDAEKYQGHSYTRLYGEELTNWASPRGIDRMKATLRSATGVPVGFRASANPGGPGHHWVKARYIDPAPAGYTLLKDEGNQSRVFIPARLKDNNILTLADPGYADRLKGAGSEALVRAWLDGDWSVVEGAYFDCWQQDKHVVRPFEMPEHWMRFRAVDWGSAKPFSVGWWAIASETIKTPDGHVIPRDAMVRYREWYGAKEPNVGLKMRAQDVAQGVKDRTPKGEKINYTVCDPAMWIEDGGPSIAEMFETQGVYCTRADNKRIPGWVQLRNRLIGEDGKPMLYVFSTCGALIRTLPALQHSDLKPEDVDTDGEDHAPDETRYACQSRPWNTALRQNKALRPNDAYSRHREERAGESYRTI
jgi:hypothetical protein